MLRYDLQIFAKEGPGGEKTEEATPKKLEDARKKYHDDFMKWAPLFM